VGSRRGCRTAVGEGRERGAVDDRELVGHGQRRSGDLRQAPQLGVALGHLRRERHRRSGSELSRGSRGPRRSGGGVQSHGNARKIRVARGMGGEHTWCGLHPQHEQELLEHEVELVHARAHLTCRRATHAFMQVRIRSGSRRKRYEAQGAWLASEYMSCPSAACARAHRTPRGGRARRQERRVAGYHFLFYSCGSHLKLPMPAGCTCGRRETLTNSSFFSDAHSGYLSRARPSLSAVRTTIAAPARVGRVQHFCSGIKTRTW
jgi:hypothetical protein